MYILANLYFDPIAMYHGLVFLLSSIILVLTCEYITYRIIIPEQGPLRSFLTSIYTNLVSGVLSIFCFETAQDMVWDYVTTGTLSNIILFIVFWILTCFLEILIVLPLHKILRIKKVFKVLFIANTLSYILLAIMIGIYSLLT
jgi:hypothetical protein